MILVLLYMCPGNDMAYCAVCFLPPGSDKPVTAPSSTGTVSSCPTTLLTCSRMSPTPTECM